VQAGCEHEFVLLFSYGRVGDVGVAKIILPSEPFADLCDRAKTEVGPVVAPAVRQVWEKREVLQQGRALAEFERKFFANLSGC